MYYQEKKIQFNKIDLILQFNLANPIAIEACVNANWSRAEKFSRRNFSNVSGVRVVSTDRVERDEVSGLASRQGFFLENRFFVKWA